MSPRRIAFLLLAAFVSIMTIFLGRAWLQAERASPAQAAMPPPKPATLVLVAKGDLSVGQFLRADNLRWQPWPEDSIGAAYIVGGRRTLEEFAGAVVRRSLSDGEPITEGRVVRPGDRGFLAAVLTPGNRAVTVPVTLTSGLAGFVFPGDRVDLILTFVVPADAPNQRERRASETVITDVRVLAVDQRVDDQKKDVVVAKTATLEVTPKQAETIAVVSELGKVSLSLRSLAPNENAPEEPTPRTSYTWDSDAARLLPAPNVAAAMQKVRVVRGADVTELQFSRGAR